MQMCRSASTSQSTHSTEIEVISSTSGSGNTHAMSLRSQTPPVSKLLVRIRTARKTTKKPDPRLDGDFGTGVAGSFLCNFSDLQGFDFLFTKVREKLIAFNLIENEETMINYDDSIKTPFYIREERPLSLTKKYSTVPKTAMIPLLRCKYMEMFHKMVKESSFQINPSDFVLDSGCSRKIPCSNVVC